MAHGKSLQLRNIVRPRPQWFFIPGGVMKVKGRRVIAPPQYRSIERAERKRRQIEARRAARARRQAQGR